MTGTRRAGSVALAIVGAILALLGGVLLYARVALFDSSRFADRAASALAEERVADVLTEPIVNAIVDSGPVELINAQPIVEAAVAGMLETAAFRSAFHDATRNAHAALFDGEVDALVLNLADAGVIAIEAVRSISPRVAEQIPDDVEPELVEITESELALELADLAHDVRLMGVLLPALALICLAGSVALAPLRRDGLVRAAAALAVAAGTGIALLLVGRSLVAGQFPPGSLHDATRATWDAFFADLTLWFVAAGAGSVITAATAYSGMREVDPAAPLRAVARVASWRPARPLTRLARAGAIVAVSLLLVLRPEAGLHVLVVAIGGWGLFVAATEILLVVAPPPEVRPGAPGRAEGFAQRLRPGRAAGVLAGLAALTVAAVVVIAGGGGEEAGGRPPGPVSACNGHAELCDRTIDQVAFATTHNSMSAARERGWYLPNQRHGIARQLEDGIRAFQIDTHYGIETEDGNVVTDIERSDVTRQEIVELIGEEGLMRAEAIRARIEGDADPANAQPYLCHVFCELGATELTAALTDVREFLEVHPDEVVVLFVEDVVTPVDALPAFEDSGILRYAYVHRRGAPFPTLRELIEADTRVLILGENHSGGAALPWYHEGFALVQETPYTFTSEEEIASRGSCSPNRGTEDNPLFQLNNWVERIPRSPDLAGRVNEHEALLGRARLCERIRGLRPNLLAVDHYDRGDVVAVTNALNGLDPDAEAEVRTLPGSG